MAKGQSAESGTGTNVSSPPPPAPGQLGLKDNEEVRRALAEISAGMDRAEAARKAANDEMAGYREQVKARGIDLDAFLAARKQAKKMTPERRESFDTDLAISRKALGLPIQVAIFEPAEEETAPAKH